MAPSMRWPMLSGLSSGLIVLPFFKVTESSPSEMGISEYVKNLQAEIYGEDDRPKGLAGNVVRREGIATLLKRCSYASISLSSASLIRQS